MPIILLIRHGETDYVKKRRLAGRMAGVHINQKGQKQAASLAERLAKAPVKAIYSSPLERTMETARPIAQAFQLEVTGRGELIEVDCGEWQDQSLGKLRRMKIWKVVQHTPSVFTFPGGETFGAAQMRIVDFLLSLTNQFEAKDTVICVSHGDPIRLALAFFIGLPLDSFQRLVVSPGSISTLMVETSGSTLLNMNLAADIPNPVK